MNRPTSATPATGLSNGRAVDNGCSRIFLALLLVLFCFGMVLLLFFSQGLFNCFTKTIGCHLLLLTLSELYSDVSI